MRRTAKSKPEGGLPAGPPRGAAGRISHGSLKVRRVAPIMGVRALPLYREKAARVAL